MSSSTTETTTHATTTATTTHATSSAVSATKLTGRVKWFNNNAGYGFITVTDGDRSGADIFVHHSAIVVTSDQYKYLVQGEYITFSLITTDKSAHEVQAVDVSGINGGKLMCETRRDLKTTRTEYVEKDKEQEAPTHKPKSRAPPGLEQTQTQPLTQDGGTWTYAGKPQRGPSDSTRGGRGANAGRGASASRGGRGAGASTGTGRGSSAGRGPSTGRGSSASRGGRGAASAKAVV